jgi:hypothetical protein
MSRVIPAVATFAIFGVSAILAFDANSFVLQRADPAHGHLVKGCYTLLDDLLRTAKPNGVLRGLELLSPLVLIPAGIALSRVGRSRTDD